MKKNILLLICLFLSGCVTVGVEQTPQGQGIGKGQSPLTNIRLVYPGMALQDVRNIMGDQVVIGYQQSDQNPGAFDILTVKSPYREESFSTRDGESVQIFYYFTSVMKADDVIAEEELTPVVFQGDKVIVKGWDDFFRFKNQW